MEPLERLERVQFTLNFEPGTLNDCSPINDLNIWNLWNGWNVWNEFSYIEL